MGIDAKRTIEEPEDPLRSVVEMLNRYGVSAYFKKLNDGLEEQPFPDMESLCFKKAMIIYDKCPKSIEFPGEDNAVNLLHISRIVDGGKDLNVTEIYPFTMGELLVENYKEPDELNDIVRHIGMIAISYLGFAIFPRLIPVQVIHKIDIVAFGLMNTLGQIGVALSRGIEKHRHRKSVVKGKLRQKGQTIDRILKAYKEIGAQWCNDEPRKRPILLKHERIAISKLAGKVFMHFDGGITQRHINNYLKELHEKGEI
jgi:hypothetical protein